jgi:hypothetical protein
MVDSGTGEDNKQNAGSDPAHALIRRSRILVLLTFVAVILVSPISFVLGLPLGISPHDWLASWTHWTVVFISAAIVIALLGFEAALAYRLRAERISRAPHA